MDEQCFMIIYLGEENNNAARFLDANRLSDELTHDDEEDPSDKAHPNKIIVHKCFSNGRNLVKFPKVDWESGFIISMETLLAANEATTVHQLIKDFSEDEDAISGFHDWIIRCISSIPPIKKN